MSFQLESGTSILFVGANGGGKTRLAVKIEEDLGERAHRIAAHRALTLNPDVPKVSERVARAGLRSGYPQDQGPQNMMHRPGNRWGHKPAVSLLSDYDFVVQVLFGEQANTSLKTHRNIRAGIAHEPVATNFERLIEIWDRLLPHRRLEISGDDIKVALPDNTGGYRASEMSDGERAIFYLIGQTLLAEAYSVIIFDEPELHIHRAIMSPLWDELEAARPDCGMILISHDLDFVAARRGQKYVLISYGPSVGWEIESVPEDTGFTEEITSLILGSRKPILFVEGQESSLDKAISALAIHNLPSSLVGCVNKSSTLLSRSEQILDLRE
jgi:AAA domain, putative AbiEii toxin, Type IV TA system